SDLAEARAAKGWDHPAFTVPDDVAAAWRRGAAERNRAAYAAWQARREALPAPVRAEFDRVSAGRLPETWRDALRTQCDRLAAAGAARPSIE
ncbi:hypothetical protein, partial [Acinetobacter baumannii]|uniref:hypothetical protein n=1 Tax=Acinetobacter baumannii TaxID=470 RepID=UPI0024397F21|nr:hypothetical protein [Acinetobacter baumannii]